MDSAYDPALCRDCDARQAPGERCERCGSPRLVAHPELTGLTIAHLDCDAFYAAVEKRDDPSLADRPVIIGGGRRGVVSTACYIARIKGVRSAMPMFKALRACPEAVVVKPDMAKYVAVSRQIRSMMLDLTPLIEPLSLDEAFLDLTGGERLHGASAATMMMRLQRRIEAEIGVTASVGLSYCKYLAKMASDIDKPRGFTVIGRAEAVGFLDLRPVRAIWGVGAAFAARLERDGFRSVGDLRRADPVQLLARYGSIGRRLSELSHGIDNRRVSPDSAPKSISAETTFNEDIADPALLEGHLWRLSERVAARCKARGLAGRTVTLKLKTPAFRGLTRRVTAPAPMNLADTIFRAARPLLSQMATGKAPFRLIGVGVSSLAPADPDDEPMADLLDPGATSRARAERAMDRVRARYGDKAIVKGRGWRGGED